MDGLGLGLALVYSVCTRIFLCGGMGVLFTIGLVGVITSCNRHAAPAWNKKRWGSFALILVGGAGLTYFVGILITNIVADQNAPKCLELSVTDEYKITFTPSYHEARLIQSTGQTVELPAIYSYTLADHYLIGRTTDPQGGYFWFDLKTRISRRFAYDQRPAFVQSVKDQGIPEVPLYLTIEEQCKVDNCRPCKPDTQ